jgi:hypothetical protein
MYFNLQSCFRSFHFLSFKYAHVLFLVSRISAFPLSLVVLMIKFCGTSHLEKAKEVS